MKNLNNIAVAEVADEAKQVFVPNRYQKVFVAAFQELIGEEIPKQDDRKAKVESNGRTYWWVRGRDVPQVVELAGAEMDGVVGLTGSEWCMEYACNQRRTTTVMGKMTQKRMGRIALIAPETAEIARIKSRLRSGTYPLGVITAYPGIVNGLGIMERFNILCQVALNGGVEGVAEAIGLPAVDLVSNEANTVKQNNFVVIENLLDVFPVLVAPGGGQTDENI
ncbi:MAG: hypothetical protein V4702_00760 [Patescibacteria group bacterium]